MAIQIPSAAGFIPQESVLDGLTKLFNLFGKDQTDARRAGTAKVKADTRQTNMQTDYIPKTFEEGQRQFNSTNDINSRNAESTRINADANSRQVDNQNTQFNRQLTELGIPQMIFNAGVNQQNANTNERQVENQNNQFSTKFYGLDLPSLIYQQANEAADRAIKEKQVDANIKNSQFQNALDYDSQKLRWTELGQKGWIAKEEIQRLQDSTPQLMELYKIASLNPENASMMQPMLLELLKKIAPQSAAAVDEVLKSQMAELNKKTQQAAGTKGQLPPNYMNPEFQPKLPDDAKNKGYYVPGMDGVLPPKGMLRVPAGATIFE